MPSLDTFPYKQFGSLAARYWRRYVTSDLGYGEAGGALELRQQIAIYLREARGVMCEADQVIVVGSTLQAASLTTHLLLDVGDTVAVEDPGYGLLTSTLRSAGLTLAPVPVCSTGFDADDLRRWAPNARLAVISPVGQFPAGSTFSPEARASLVDWASGSSGWLFEDDFNSEIRWGGVPHPSLAALDSNGRVIHASSFNRVLAPGFRLAYLVVPRPLVVAFTALQDALSCYAPLTHQHLVADFMASGEFAAHIRRNRALYRSRSQALTAALRESLGDVFEIPELNAGLHLSLRARESMDDAALSKSLRKIWIDAPPISSYCLEREDLSGLVIGFGNLPVNRADAAVARLARSVRHFLQAGLVREQT